jgi:hypothetical protein
MLPVSLDCPFFDCPFGIIYRLFSAIYATVISNNISVYVWYVPAPTYIPYWVKSCPCCSVCWVYFGLLSRDLFWTILQYVSSSDYGIQYIVLFFLAPLGFALYIGLNDIYVIFCQIDRLIYKRRIYKCTMDLQCSILRMLQDLLKSSEFC